MSTWTAIDWRAHVRWVRVDGQALNIVELGEGDETVLFIHGVGGAWQNWLENLPAVAAAGYRVVALDLPGFGASPLPAEPFTIPSLARLVRGLLDQLGIERAALVGNSMGGFVAAETAIAHAARVERLVLVSAAGGLPVSRVRDRLGLSAFRLSYPFTPPVIARRTALIRRPRLRRRCCSRSSATPRGSGPSWCGRSRPAPASRDSSPP
jgi:pimeloyl-ACP methyl ester carboxylesterase